MNCPVRASCCISNFFRYFHEKQIPFTLIFSVKMQVQWICFKAVTDFVYIAMKFIFKNVFKCLESFRSLGFTKGRMSCPWFSIRSFYVVFEGVFLSVEIIMRVTLNVTSNLTFVIAFEERLGKNILCI